MAGCRNAPGWHKDLAQASQFLKRLRWPFHFSDAANPIKAKVRGFGAHAVQIARSRAARLAHNLGATMIWVARRKGEGLAGMRFDEGSGASAAALKAFAMLLVPGRIRCQVYASKIDGMAIGKLIQAACAERAGEKNCAELRARPVRLLCPRAVKPALCELVDSSSAAEAA
jgi:hypothetical protein